MCTWRQLYSFQLHENVIFVHTTFYGKDVNITEDLANELMEELNCETVFTLPVFGGIPITESTAVTWVIILIVAILCVLLVRNLKVEHPGKRQLFLEVCVSKLYDFFHEIFHGAGDTYIPYLAAVAIYLGFANLIGLLGLKPPTKDLTVTAALSIMSILLIQYASIAEKGVKGWIHGFAEPIAIITPINILELFIKPLSLCMRLFGNVLGAFVVMELIKILVPIALPVPFSFYFDIFDGLIQAYVFVFLTALFIKENLE